MGKIFIKISDNSFEITEEDFDNAIVKTLEKLDKDYSKANDKNNKELNSMNMLVFSLQNLMAMQELKKTLFNKEQ